MEWLKNLFPEPEIQTPTSPTGFQAVPFFLQIVIYALALALIGFLIYKFAPFLINRFQTREKREKRERVILGEKLAADETSGNLFSEAERMAQAGDLRGAIRKGYIALLCELVATAKSSVCQKTKPTAIICATFANAASFIKI